MRLSGVSVLREYAKNLSVKSLTRSRLLSFSHLKVSNTMTAMYGVSHQLSELNVLFSHVNIFSVSIKLHSMRSREWKRSIILWFCEHLLHLCSESSPPNQTYCNFWYFPAGRYNVDIAVNFTHGVNPLGRRIISSFLFQGVRCDDEEDEGLGDVSGHRSQRIP